MVRRRETEQTFFNHATPPPQSPPFPRTSSLPPLAPSTSSPNIEAAKEPYVFTQRKIDSARANGAKSHGPVTEDGRKESSMNALKHGLTARTFLFSNDNHDEYNALFESYIESRQPIDPVEMDLVVDMVNAKWQQRRVQKFETELFDREMDIQKVKNHLTHPALYRKVDTWMRQE